MVMYGGSPDEYDDDRPCEDDSRIAETTIITFGELCCVPSCLLHLCVCSTVIRV